MNYFISDLHFGHRSVIRQCGRPFSSVEAMDDALIERWNRRVQGGDTVYILGDLAHRSDRGAAYYLSRLKGRKVLIRGNHDGAAYDGDALSSFFYKVTSYQELCLDGRHLTLCHYPLLEWKNSRKEGSRKLGYLIHGHIHNRTDPLYAPLFARANALNAAAELNGYEPVLFEELFQNNERQKLSLLPSPVEQALFLCRSYHRHQSDKAGEPYWLHPQRVAAGFSDETHRIVALLHDTLEDTDLAPEKIGSLFGERVLSAVLSMTHREGEDYFSYLERVKKDPVAREVKRADLLHNMDLSRLRTVTEADLLRVEKYQKALALLEDGT